MIIETAQQIRSTLVEPACGRAHYPASLRVEMPNGR